jgi:hypothetical protein
VVDLFGGAVTATFAAPSVEVEAAIRSKLRLEEAAGAFGPPDDPARGVKLLERFNDLWFGATLARVGAPGVWEVVPAGSFEAVRAGIKSATVYSAVRLEAVRFQQTLQALLRHATDPDFFRATAPGGASSGSPSVATTG